MTHFYSPSDVTRYPLCTISLFPSGINYMSKIDSIPVFQNPSQLTYKKGTASGLIIARAITLGGTSCKTKGIAGK
jgi:hypothetical protein